MPMVDTSVAVAMPSITAVRMRKGSASAGQRDDEGAPDHRARAARRDAARFSPRQRQRATTDERQRQHQRRQQAAGEQRGDRHAGDRADGDQHQAGGMVSAHRAGGGQQRNQLAFMAPRRFISGNSTGATAAMSAAFEPEMPETRYIAPSST